MKLYLSNMELNKIQLHKLAKYLINKEKIIELYSDGGIYVCKNSQGFRKLEIVEGNINIFENYLENNSLVVDESYVFKSKDYTSNLPSQHNAINLVKFEYKTAEKSPVTLIIEKTENTVTNMYFMLMNNHGKYTAPDINNQFTKETIQLFHSLTL
jgi:hypothetical protein